ncbi:MAG: hypothetical protein KDA88_07635 [Planctomycetaceae bacterium]|nr:hypothetical protein [Planctomycetaceae bacterium]MCB9949520.1 hypothetical protein [Planctomycetaceae bacterium]
MTSLFRIHQLVLILTVTDHSVEREICTGTDSHPTVGFLKWTAETPQTNSQNLKSSTEAMTGYTTHSGPNKKFNDGWARVFGGKTAKAAASKETKTKTEKPKRKKK